MSETKPPRIFIGPSVWRQFEMVPAACLINLCNFLSARQIPYVYRPDWGDADIARSRSKVATRFLESDADVLLVMDSDMEYAPEDALKICMAAIEKESIVGGAFMKRGGDHDPALPFPLNKDILMWRGQTLEEVDYVSTGFCAISRKVFEKLAETSTLLHPSNTRGGSFYPFYHHNPGYVEFGGELIWMSEDWALCENAKQQGFTMWMDPTIRLSHWGVHDFRVEDFLMSMPGRKRPENAIPIQLGRHAAPEGGRYYKISTPQVAEQLRVNVADEPMDVLVDAADTKVGKAIREQGVWEPAVSDVVLNAKEKNFLDLGAHCGWFSLVAARSGKNVLAVEPQGFYAEIIRQAAELNKMTIKVEQVAVGASEGKVPFAVTSGNTGESHVGKAKAGEQQVEVDMKTLPEILGDYKPDFIKMDIEGFEEELLKAYPTVFKAASRVIFETHPGNEKKLTQWFKKAGFVVKQIHKNEFYADYLAYRSGT